MPCPMRIGPLPRTITTGFPLRFSVRDSQAASVQGLLGHVKVPSGWKGYRASWTDPVVDSEAGTTTLKVKVCITGMRIIFR